MSLSLSLSLTLSLSLSICLLALSFSSTLPPSLSASFAHALPLGLPGLLLFPINLNIGRGQPNHQGQCGGFTRSSRFVGQFWARASASQSGDTSMLLTWCCKLMHVCESVQPSDFMSCQPLCLVLGTRMHFVSFLRT